VLLPTVVLSVVIAKYSSKSRDGVQKRYLVPLSKHILVQDNDFVRAGQPLSDGSITPSDILSIKVPTAVQEYLVNEIQEVYRLQGVKINDKHIEAIVSQMMQKVEIIDRETQASSQMNMWTSFNSGRTMIRYSTRRL
jgi:hypothetical protein